MNRSIQLNSVGYSLESCRKATRLVCESLEVGKDLLGNPAIMDTAQIDKNQTYDYVNQKNDEKFKKQFDEDENKGEKKECWSEDGRTLIYMPQEAVDACSHSGRCDDDVAFWLEELDFGKGMDLKKAKGYIQATGGWEHDEIKKMTDDEVAEKILWLAANDIKEFQYDLENHPEDHEDQTKDDWVFDIGSEREFVD